MAIRNTATNPAESKAAIAAWRRGTALAAEMRQAADRYEGECHWTDEFRYGAPFYNIVADYLARVRAVGHPNAEAAFTAALSCVITGNCGGEYEAQAFRKHVRRPIPFTVRPPAMSAGDRFLAEEAAATSGEYAGRA